MLKCLLGATYTSHLYYGNNGVIKLANIITSYNHSSHSKYDFKYQNNVLIFITEVQFITTLTVYSYEHHKMNDLYII